MKKSRHLGWLRPRLFVGALVASLPLHLHAQNVTDPAYTISTLTNGVVSISGITADPTTGTLYAGNTNSTSTAVAYKITSAGVVTNLGLNTVTGYPYVASDIQVLGNVLYTASFSSIVSSRSTTAGGGASTAFTVTGAGNEMGLTTKNGLLYATGSNGRIVSYNPATGVTTTLSTSLPSGASSLSPDPRSSSNYLYFATYGSVTFHRFDLATNTVDANFVITGGSTYGNFAVDPTGQYIFTKLNNTVNKISVASPHVVTTFVTSLSDSNYGSVCFGPSSNGTGQSLYIADGNAIREVKGFSGGNQIPVAFAGADQTVAASGSGTASVVLNGTGSVDPDSDPLTYAWTWSGGSATGATPTITLSLGATTVTLTVDDGKGGTASDAVIITVADLTPPVITAAALTTAEATSASGAIVTFTATATDAISGPATVTATPPSGSTFAVGLTSVSLSATDAAGNTATKSILITVTDTTAPVIAVPSNLTVEATSATGAVVNFTATAIDLVDGAVSVSASKASGSTFAIGTTTVTLTATDAHHNTATRTFSVSVVDTTAPTLAVPTNQVIEATSAAGAVATFAASATDAVGVTSLTSSAASGSTFAIGTTTVTVAAKDAAGNTSTGSFTITVVDTTAPVIASLGTNAPTLWPANHKMVAVTVSATASDLVGVASLKIVSATSNEPDDGLGDGDTAGDIVLTGDLTLNLRAERAGNGSGRIYSITVEARDAAGNATTKVVTVSVPKSQSGK